MAKVRCEMKVYEIDGKEVPAVVGAKPPPLLTVESHWNRPQLVLLKFGDVSISVSSSELQACVANATNTGRL